jgi:hypothetical protein
VLLRDDLEQFLLSYVLVDSYANFIENDTSYPFVEMRELKPRARIPNVEYSHQNAFLIIFMEDTVPAGHKKYIRFFDDNKTTKANLLHCKSLPLSARGFDRTQKYLESARFIDFVKMLLPVDYALLIQRDPAARTRDRYVLSHFHVRIDWPIVDAAEDMARYLRYISKDIYEKGEKYAEDIQKKFFEYYGLPAMAGGRRTAAIIAAQYLRRIPCISTIYVASSESRALIRFSETGIQKTVLVQFTKQQTLDVARANHMNPAIFIKNYVIVKNKNERICLFEVNYNYTTHAQRPLDGKLRELNPDNYWLTVCSQFIIPKPGIWRYPPLPINLIYA